MDPYVRGNQELWEEWADINFESASYGVDSIRNASW